MRMRKPVQVQDKDEEEDKDEDRREDRHEDKNEDRELKRVPPPSFLPQKPHFPNQPFAPQSERDYAA